MGWNSSPPAGPTTTVEDSIGSGNTVVLVPANQNPLGLQIWSISISSGANGGSSSFLVEDTITDNMGNTYLSCEIGLPNTGGVGHNTTPPSMQGIIVPAGASLSLNNGGAGGGIALRRCAGTVIYTQLSN